jgi:putative ABC transport system permease protein
MQTPLVWAVVSVAVLALVSLLVLRLAGVRAPTAAATALLRGGLQLAALSVVLTGVITSPWWTALAIAVMFVAAVFTSARRIGLSRRVLTRVAAAMGCGIAASLLIVFATGAVPLTPRYALALCGIVIGNAMTVSSLAGGGLLRSAAERWPEVEGWLALGATPGDATLPIARDAVYRALVPSIDQTRTTGLVVLPGAFVGAIFGGLSPLEAGAFQLVVLGAILCSGSIAAVLLTRGLRAISIRPTVD